MLSPNVKLSMEVLVKTAYQETVFEVDGHLPACFAIITAYNPLGRSAPSSRNQHQDLTLRAVLEGRGCTPIRVTGRDRGDAHREPGWAAELSLKDALEIGNIFKQEAIYYVSDGKLSLHRCDGRESIDLGDWASRVQSEE